MDLESPAFASPCPPPPSLLAALKPFPAGLTPGDLARRLKHSPDWKSYLDAHPDQTNHRPSEFVWHRALEWCEAQMIWIELPKPGQKTIRLVHPEHVPSAKTAPPPGPAIQSHEIPEIPDPLPWPLLPLPESDRDQAFLIQVAGRMVSAWKRTPCPTTKRTLQALLNNFGLARVGVAGEVVGFRGRRHECTEPVDIDHPVRVEEPGWLLRDCPGDQILQKAVVQLDKG